MKKILILGLAVAAIYFGWKFMPSDWRTKIESAVTRIGISKERIIGALQPARKYLLPADALTREDLMRQLSDNLEIAKKYQASKLLEEKALLDKALKDSQEILTTLQSTAENSDFFKTLYVKLINTLIHHTPGSIH